MSDGDELVIQQSHRWPAGRVAEYYIVEGEPGIHWRWADE